MSADSNPPARIFDFDALPPELRNRIWTYCLPSEDRCIVITGHRTNQQRDGKGKIIGSKRGLLEARFEVPYLNMFSINKESRSIATFDCDLQLSFRHHEGRAQLNMLKDAFVIKDRSALRALIKPEGRGTRSLTGTAEYAYFRTNLRKLYLPGDMWFCDVVDFVGNLPNLETLALEEWPRPEFRSQYRSHYELHLRDARKKNGYDKSTMVEVIFITGDEMKDVLSLEKSHSQS